MGSAGETVCVCLWCMCVCVCVCVCVFVCMYYVCVLYVPGDADRP